MLLIYEIVIFVFTLTVPPNIQANTGPWGRLAVLHPFAPSWQVGRTASSTALPVTAAPHDVTGPWGHVDVM